MRLTAKQVGVIRGVVSDLAGEAAVVRLFGSRIDDQAKGGDIDLLVELPYPVDEPAWLSARISSKISMLMDGRKVDVLLDAPNLSQFPIHDVARTQGIRL